MTLAAWLRLFVYDAPKPVRDFVSNALSCERLSMRTEQSTVKIASEAIALSSGESKSRHDGE